jgi:hypothetical protein
VFSGILGARGRPRPPYLAVPGTSACFYPKLSMWATAVKNNVQLRNFPKSAVFLNQTQKIYICILPNYGRHPTANIKANGAPKNISPAKSHHLQIFVNHKLSIYFCVHLFVNIVFHFLRKSSILQYMLSDRGLKFDPFLYPAKTQTKQKLDILSNWLTI